MRNTFLEGWIQRGWRVKGLGESSPMAVDMVPRSNQSAELWPYSRMQQMIDNLNYILQVKC